jgi:hypothetical protein
VLVFFVRARRDLAGGIKRPILKEDALKTLFTLCLLLGALAAGPLAADSPLDVTPTVKAGNLTVKLSDVLLTPKPGYVHMLFDAYPYRDDIPKDGMDQVLKTIAKDLVKDPLLVKFPKTTKVKADMVQFSQRDDYGAPRWDSVTKLAHYEISLKKGKVKIDKATKP